MSGRAEDPSRLDWSGGSPRPLLWTAWYPADEGSVEIDVRLGPRDLPPAFLLGAVAESAPLSAAAASFPVVLVSHGTGGSAHDLSWLGLRLAAHGFVVVGVSHHGNTSLEPYRAEGFLCWWERAPDLTVLLDQLATGGAFADRLDLARVYAVGFSLGAYTVLALTGARTQLELFRAWGADQPLAHGPAEFPDVAAHIEPLLATSASFRAAWARQSNVHHDPRVRAALLCAPPPPVRAFTAESLRAIAVPVELMAALGDREAPFADGAAWLQQQLARCHLTTLGTDVGHYVFLCESTASGRVRLPSLCVDEPNVDRRTIHDQATSLARSLFSS